MAASLERVVRGSHCDQEGRTDAGHDRSQRIAQAVRAGPGAGRHVVHRRARPGHRLRRPERGRQVHHHAGHTRPGRGRRGQGPGRRQAVRQPAAADAGPRLAAGRGRAAAEPYRPQPPALAGALAGPDRQAGGRDDRAGGPAGRGQAASGRLLAGHAAAAGHRRGDARRPGGDHAGRAVQRDGPGGNRVDARVPAVAGRRRPGGAGVQSPDERASGHRGSSDRRRARQGDRRHDDGEPARDRLRRPGDATYHRPRAGHGSAEVRRGAGRGQWSRRAPVLGHFGRTGGGAPIEQRRPVLRGFRPPGQPGAGLPGADQAGRRVPPVRIRLRRRAGRASRPGGAAMTTRAISVPRPEAGLGDGPRGGFGGVLRAEWTKFHSVRGWVIGMILAALLMIFLGVFAAANGFSSCGVPGGPQETGKACLPYVPYGPGGEVVTDSFSFVHQPLTGNGSITARVTALRTEQQTSPDTTAPLSVPWAKAGIIVKQSTKQGSAYAAVMVTGGNGVRMQYDYTGDIAGPPGGVSAAHPRWLRLTRSGDTLTGYDSADGTHWTAVGTVRLSGLPSTVQVGMFATSPQYFQTSLGVASVSGGPSE